MTGGTTSNKETLGLNLRSSRTALVVAAAAFAIGSSPPDASARRAPMQPASSTEAILHLAYSAAGAGPSERLDSSGESPARRRSNPAWREGRRYVDSSGRVLTAERVRTYLSAVRSPMEGYAEHIIASSNAHGVDPRLVIAIAGVESSFGKRCRGFNAWGWGGGRARWGSWPDAIEGFTRSFADGYRHRDNIRRLAQTYNPNTPDAWAGKVLYLMSSIDQVHTSPRYNGV